MMLILRKGQAPYQQHEHRFHCFATICPTWRWHARLSRQKVGLDFETVVEFFFSSKKSSKVVALLLLPVLRPSEVIWGPWCTAKNFLDKKPPNGDFHIVSRQKLGLDFETEYLHCCCCLCYRPWTPDVLPKASFVDKRHPNGNYHSVPRCYAWRWHAGLSSQAKNLKQLNFSRKSSGAEKHLASLLLLPYVIEEVTKPSRRLYKWVL